jgi:hypothetical protein
MAVKATFRGHPVYAFVNGIPARDLDDADWELLDEEHRQLADESPLYVVAGGTPKGALQSEPAAQPQIAPPAAPAQGAS